MFLQEPGSGDQRNTHKHRTYVLKHIWKEKEKKKNNGQRYSGNTTETGCFELLSTAYLRHQDKFQAKILADLCCVEECLHTIFYLFIPQKPRWSKVNLTWTSWLFTTSTVIHVHTVLITTKKKRRKTVSLSKHLHLWQKTHCFDLLWYCTSI